MCMIIAGVAVVAASTVAAEEVVARSSVPLGRIGCKRDSEHFVLARPYRLVEGIAEDFAGHCPGLGAC